MKLKKILKRLKAYLDGDVSNLHHTEKGLGSVLEKLKHREISLQDAITSESDPDERLLMEQELLVLRSQKRKGERLLSQLKEHHRD